MPRWHDGAGGDGGDHPARVPVRRRAARRRRWSAGSAQTPPSRIVSLVPAATEMLFAIGAGPRVVAVSSYDHEPPEVDTAAACRGAARSRPRADPRTAAGPGRRVRHAARPESSSSTRAAIADVHLHPRRPGRGDVHHPCARRPGPARQRARRPLRPGSSVTLARSAIALAAARARRRCWCSAGSRARCEICTRAAASGSCTTCSRSPAARNVFADQKRESVQASTETLLAAAPEVVIETARGSRRRRRPRRVAVAARHSRRAFATPHRADRHGSGHRGTAGREGHASALPGRCTRRRSEARPVRGIRRLRRVRRFTDDGTLATRGGAAHRSRAGIRAYQASSSQRACREHKHRDFNLRHLRNLRIDP